ncbi:hypothetical protein K488DRAFT_90813 [Vararia minispora EC-137]|uniref:Uncharacterized protein n=1 Tax=Vararia minispora EC-137 TaxID=1314806 RepID=A0ACB8Q6T9_9AGAM|nr:hypothetical protein K488DRAFT_90813 [Vararia minispora EC-137]
MAPLWSVITGLRRRTATSNSRVANEGAGRLKWTNVKSRLWHETAADEGLADVLDIRRATNELAGPITAPRLLLSVSNKIADQVRRAGVEGTTLEMSSGARIEGIVPGAGGWGRDDVWGANADVRGHDQASGDDVRSDFRARPLPLYLVVCDLCPHDPFPGLPLRIPVLALVPFCPLPLYLVVCDLCPHDPFPGLPLRISVQALNLPGSPSRTDTKTAPTAGNYVRDRLSLLADVVSPPAADGPLQPGVRSSFGERSMYRAAMRHSVDSAGLYLVFEDGDLTRATGEGANVF